MKIFKIIFLFLILPFGILSCGDNMRSQKTAAIEDFFSQPERESFKLSPDGKKISYLGYDEHCRNIFILDIKNPDSSKQLTYQDNLNVQYYFWVDDKYIIYSNSQSAEDSLRLMVINVETEERKQLLPPTAEKLRWVWMGDDAQLLASISKQGSSMADLYRIGLHSGEKELLFKNPGNIARWYATSDGDVKLALTSDSLDESLLYRTAENQIFKEVKKNNFITSIYPIGFVKDSSSKIYALSNENRDKIALVEMDLNTGEETQELFSHPIVDVNYEGYKPNLHEMLFASYTVDKNEQYFFDKELETIISRIKGEFQDDLVRILDVKVDTKQIIFKIYSDINPGSIYYYDGRVDSYEKLSDVLPRLNKQLLNHKESVEFTTRDDLTISGYLTYPKAQKQNLPLVVLVHDGPGKRDVWEFDPEVQFLSNLGYAVFQINYRGSAGFGKEFWTAGFKEWGGKVQTDIIDGVTWLIHQGVVDKERIAIMGTGFGGYSALHAATFNTSMFKCAISASGYSNLFTFFKEIPPHLQQYLQLYYEVIGNPHVEPKLFRAISPVFHADQVKIPVMFVQGGKDNYSSLTDINQFVQTLKNNRIPVRFIYREDEGRRFKNEENIVSYYLEVEDFLNTYLK